MKTEPTPRILLVDNQPENLLESVIDEASSLLVKVPSCLEGVKELLKQDFALILLNVQMLAMDRLERLDLIERRAKIKEIPIFFISPEYQPSFLFQ